MSLTVGIVWDIQELLSVVEFHVYNRWSGKQIMRIAGQEHGLLFVKPDGQLPSCILFLLDFHQSGSRFFF